MITQQVRKSSLLAALMSTALLAGCGGGHKAVSRRTDAAKPGSTSPTRAMKFQLAADSTGPVNAEVPSQPIGSTPTSINGIALQLYLAKRQSTGAVLVVFALQMDASARSHLNSESVPLGLSANADPKFGGTLTKASVSGVALLDPAGLKKYETYMSNSSDDATCLCSLVGPGTSGSGVAGASATTSYYAALVAAPPPSVTSVSFVTGLGTIGNVTLSG